MVLGPVKLLSYWDFQEMGPWSFLYFLRAFFSIDIGCGFFADNAFISPELQTIFERVRDSADFMPRWQLEVCSYFTLLLVLCLLKAILLGNNDLWVWNVFLISESSSDRIGSQLARQTFRVRHEAICCSIHWPSAQGGTQRWALCCYKDSGMKGSNEKHWKCHTFYFFILTIQYCSYIARHLDYK